MFRLFGTVTLLFVGKKVFEHIWKTDFGGGGRVTFQLDRPTDQVCKKIKCLWIKSFRNAGADLSVALDKPFGMAFRRSFVN